MQIEVNSLKISLGDFGFQIPQWSLAPRTHLLLEGPSGSGKTTFLHLLGGLFPFREGEVRIGDFQIGRMSSPDLISFRRDHCGIIFQKIHLLPHLTLKENVLLGCKTQEQSQTLDQLVKDLSLSHRLNHLPATLSLGETQRAAVARALISEPSLILADEPTSGLDDINAEKVMQLLIQSSKGKSLIVVSHDARVRKHFAQKMDFREMLK